MHSHFAYLITLLKRLGIVVFIYMLCRIFFYLFNYSHFDNARILSFAGGIRFDISAVLIMNLPIILLMLIPHPFRMNMGFQRFTKLLFILINSFAVIINCVDIEYFPYSQKRSTIDLFKLLGTGDDMQKLLPQFVKDFWHIGIIIIVLIWFMMRLYTITEKPIKDHVLNLKNFSIQFAIMFAGLVFLLVLSRGGTQIRPLSIPNAAAYPTTDEMQLVLNTPFTIIKTFGKPSLEAKNYFSEDELKEQFSIKRHYNKEGSFDEKPNVVLIILESFSKEYISSISGRTQGYTPFLDSIFNHSLVFEKAYANGKKSIEALPAILSGLPALMNNPLITSPYAQNRTNSFANILNKEGYHSSFFHGATNGSMGFDGYCDVIGFDNYYGRAEYSQEEDFDGNWGIYDEPFLDFTAKELNEFKEPFFSAVFTLSSHHPYQLPEKYQESFAGGNMEIMKTIEYTDYCLKQFFESIKNEQWAKNTLFVFTADHTAVSADPFYKNRVGIYSIPIAYYKMDGSLAGRNSSVTQQIDILPTSLDLIGYNKEFHSFGKSALDSGPGSCVNYISNVYQYFKGDYVLQYGDDKSLGLFNIRKDSSLLINRMDFEWKRKEAMERELRFTIQSYNQKMIDNELDVE